MKHNIDFGVSLYSFTQQFYEQSGFGLDDMFGLLKKLGISKFEIVGAQTFDQYPRPRSESIREFHEACDRWAMTPFSYGGYTDLGKYTGRDMTDDEIFRETLNELNVANMLGCKYMRTGKFPIKYLERLAFMAQRYNVKCGFEIHTPQRPSDPDVQAMAAEMARIGSPFLGFIPDFGCFIERPSSKLLDYYKRMGANMDIVDYIVKNRNAGGDEDSMWSQVQAMGGGEVERVVVSELFGHQTFRPADFEGFKSVLPYSLYFHGKFYHVDENLKETSIDYDKLIGYIVESGFSGVIMTEYEGHAFYTNDAVEQVSRHLAMERRILQSL